MATDYNDGKWRGWNGGDCPVHPRTLVECVCANGPDNQPPESVSLVEREADRFDWDGDWENFSLPVIAFRVIKPYRAPREWWVWFNDLGSTYISERKPNDGSAIRVREVVDD